MNSAKQLFEQGQLQAAIDQLISEVKARPTDTSARIFLFELLCFAGAYDRAEKQLDVIAMQNPQNPLGIIAYRNCLQAARERRKLWATGAQPHFLADPPDYIDWHLDAINQVRGGNAAAARALLDKAEAQRPALPGICEGAEFYDLRDADDFIAPVLEVASNDHYAWIPFEQIRELEIAAPEQLRDLLFTPVRVILIDGTQAQFFAFALYAGSSADADEQVKLGRLSEWREISTDLVRGAGTKIWMIGDEDKPILDVRTITFHTQAETEEIEADAAAE